MPINQGQHTKTIWQQQLKFFKEGVVTGISSAKPKL